MAVVHSGGTSSFVRIVLEVNGQVFRVSQVGAESLILRDSSAPEVGSKGEIRITVDDQIRVYPVLLKQVVSGNEILFSDLVDAHDAPNQF